MNTILKLGICCILVSFLGCKKEKKLPSSTWTVNGETFTAVAKVTIGKKIAILISKDFNNRFSITFLPAGLTTSAKTRKLVFGKQFNRNSTAEFQLCIC